MVCTTFESFKTGLRSRKAFTSAVDLTIHNVNHFTVNLQAPLSSYSLSAYTLHGDRTLVPIMLF